MLTPPRMKALLPLIGSVLLYAWSLAACGGSAENPNPPGADAGLSPDASSQDEDASLPDAAEDAAEDVAEDPEPLEDAAVDADPPEDAAQEDAAPDVEEPDAEEPDAEEPEDAGDPPECSEARPCPQGSCSAEGRCVSSEAACASQAECPDQETCLEGRCAIVKELVQAEQFTCALRGDGEVTCWGAQGYVFEHAEGPYAHIAVSSTNLCGVRLDGTLSCVNSAGMPEGLLVQSVSVSTSRGCALRLDGTLVCWSWSGAAVGEVPEGSFVQISAAGNSSGEYACGLRPEGEVVCWVTQGNSVYGILYNQLNPPPLTFRWVSASVTHACGLTTEHQIACWGGNSYGQLEVPEEAGFQEVVAFDPFDTCALGLDRQLRCWGRSVGLGNTPPEEPILMMDRSGSCVLAASGAIRCWSGEGRDFPPEEPYVHVAPSSGLACGLLADGTPRCWGNIMRLEPPEEPFSRLYVMGLNVCGLNAEGIVRCWGVVPIASTWVPPSWERFVDLKVFSLRNLCGVRADGSLLCWGVDSSRWNGFPPVGTFKGFVGGDLPCGIQGDNTVFCWDDLPTWLPTLPTEPVRSVTFYQERVSRSRGLCWVSLDGSQVSCMPTLTAPPENPFVEVVTGNYVACARYQDGAVHCEGGIDRGGDLNDLRPAFTPPERFTQLISNGTNGVCGLTVEGRIVCWGSDYVSRN